ncbi:beta-galactosidase [Effusibacillus pohliae]|uniref:beta-galactosidase n=1 Tax=Effusibacillus pohliae TaxID=232270 RepID=UPI002480D593|nr:beta-galactosidase [Effusibacillus pohliae]
MKQGKFIIHGEDTFLYGGEMHYFRVPKQEWEQRLDLLIEAGCNLVSTYVPWVWHEMEEGVLDLTGQTRGERDLQGFLKLIKEKGLYCIVRPGPYVMAEVRYHGIPNWLLDRYPEVIAKTRGGKEHPTKVVSYRHALFLEKVEKWYKAVNEIIAPMQISQNGPVIMYQLCNEIGMLHWVSNTSDFNPDTLRRFAAYLERKYQSIERFNAEYGLQETSFWGFVETFQKGLSDEYPPFHYEWRKFWREYLKDYVGDLRTFALQSGIDVPFIINVHGFKDYSIYSRGVDYPIGLSQLYKTAEFSDVVVAGDFYPGHIGYDTYHDLVLSSTYTRAISNKEQPLFSAEFQSGRLADRPRLYPQDLDLNTRTCVAHGMNALNYYMFVGGENYGDIGLFGRRHEWQAPIDANGNIRPNYEKAQHLGKVLQAVGKRLLNAPKKVHTFVGFNPDDYMTEVIDEREKRMIEEIIDKREHFAFDGILRLLVGANIHFEAVDLLKEIRVEEVPTLWVFSCRYMDRGLQKRLASYVKNGGKLVLYPEIPIMDLQGKACRILADELQLGKWEVVREIDTVDVLNIDSVMVKQRLRFIEFDGEAIASFTRNGKSEVAAYVKQAGSGKIVVLGLAMGQDYGYQLGVIKEIAKLIGVVGHLSSTNPDLSLVERCNEKDSFLFLNNYDEVEQRAVIYENGLPLFDGEEVVIPPRSGAIFVRDFDLAEGLTIEYATVEIVDLKQTDQTLTLTVQPVGGQGTIRIRTNGSWKSGNDGTAEGSSIVQKITASATIKFHRTQHTQHS